jgi:hypothetical protein
MKCRILTACVVVMAVALVGLFTSAYPVMGRSADDAKASGAHYSVVMTEGHNLLVTDNATNSLYFYTIDKDQPIGSPLKLRASVDLTKVGEPEITIKAGNLEGAK